MYATFVINTDCESCTRPISTNPGFMEADEYGLTCETCFIARRLKVVAVAGCYEFRGVFGCDGIAFSLFVFFSSNTHVLLQVCGRLAPFTSLLVTDTSSDLLELPIYCLKLLTKAQKLQTRNAKIR